MGPGSEYEVSVEMVQEKTADLLKNVRPPTPTRNPGLMIPSHLSLDSGEPVSRCDNVLVSTLVNVLEESRVCPPLETLLCLT